MLELARNCYLTLPSHYQNGFIDLMATAADTYRRGDNFFLMGVEDNAILLYKTTYDMAYNLFHSMRLVAPNSAACN